MHDSISIAIPTLNEQTNLRRCLSSIFRQKFKGSLEVLIIDGGSNDDTLKIAKEFNVKIFANPKKDAESGKMIGFKAATGNYFMILDADMDLCGGNYFDKLLKPMKEDPKIVGAYAKYISRHSDSFLTRYITLDPIQRDPLFRFLTVDPQKVLREKRNGYLVCEYTINRIVPHGFSIYRRHQLVDLNIDKHQKFMELDIIYVLVKNGLRYFAYVPSANLHHPFLKDIKMLIRKRVRNLRTQFFNQPKKREFTWINFRSKRDILKIILWVIYANSFIFPTMVGIYRSFRNKDLIALYEPVFTWLTTNLIIVVFLSEREGRRLITQAFK